MRDTDNAGTTHVPLTAAVRNNTRKALTDNCLKEDQEGYDIAKLYWNSVTDVAARACLRDIGPRQPYAYKMLGWCASQPGSQKPPEQQPFKY